MILKPGPCRELDHRPFSMSPAELDVAERLLQINRHQPSQRIPRQTAPRKENSTSAPRVEATTSDTSCLVTSAHIQPLSPLVRRRHWQRSDAPPKETLPRIGFQLTDQFAQDALPKPHVEIGQSSCRENQRQVRRELRPPSHRDATWALYGRLALSPARPVRH